MTAGFVLLANLAGIVLLMLLLWGCGLLRRDVSIVDIFWGFGFVLVGWFTFLLAGQAHFQSLLLLMMVTIWGLRLSGYLAWRNWGKPEDFRYAEMRSQHGQRFAIVSLITVFGLQGLLMWMISWPIQMGVFRPVGWHAGVVIGIILWGTGLFFEAVGDWQLARFKADPANRGRVMNRGLWRYTRHPNYFGDFLVWWGLYLAAVEPTSWWWTVVGPLVMSFLLIRVSGVRLLESSLRSRVPGYDEYVRNTSAFFPWPPRQPVRSD